jgi:hypothetical protein
LLGLFLIALDFLIIQKNKTTFCFQGCEWQVPSLGGDLGEAGLL